MADRFWLPTHVLFHYTSASFAAELADAAAEPYGAPLFVVGEGAQYGYGLYATDLDPFTTPREELVEACFAHAPPDHRALDGVLVLERDVTERGFAQMTEHIWLLPASPLEPVDLSRLLLGAGACADGQWKVREL